PPQAPQPAKQKNVVGIIALIVAIVGFIFACIPGALIVGWVLLPIAFILSLVSLFLKGKKKGTGIAGLIISVVGTIVGVIVFFALAASAVNDAFDPGDVEFSSAPAASDSAAAAGDQEVAAEDSDAGSSAGAEGTREN